VTGKVEKLLIDEFERALTTVLARACSFGSNSPSIAIAYSGGLDSSVLLHLAHQYAVANGVALFAFHIHHGLSPNADRWLASCAQTCARIGIQFEGKRIELHNRDTRGTEESARISRYAALGDLCRKHNVSLLLTAHHQDDQAETVLLQLLRGAGVAGLSGMDIANIAPGLLGDDTLVIGRPLLSLTRRQLEDFSAHKHIAYIEDESNADTRYVRNALRHYVMPAVAQHFPGFQERVARAARHAQSAHALTQALAEADFAHCAIDGCLDVNRLRQLDADRINNLLRYWLGLRRMRMPSTSWLGELRTQLLDAKADAQLCVTHPDGNVRRYRDRVFLTRRDDPDRFGLQPQAFRWTGEAEIHFPAYGGRLLFERAPEGIDADWLRRQDLSIRCRQGGERLKLVPNRPTRSLKHHYQALDVPPWVRERAPVIVSADRVLFAAGVGMNSACFDGTSPTPMRMRWQPDFG
jgi:tRNA(Ile)-lysidine synthase